MKAFFLLTTLSAIFLGVAWYSRLGRSTGPAPLPEYVPKVEVVRALEEHTKEFIPPEVIRVTEGVYVAVGYALANSIMLEGKNGLIIVDTLESEEAAIDVLNAFRNISKKPVTAIIYTHYHPDHIFGAAIFADAPPTANLTDIEEDQNNHIDVIAHSSTRSYLDKMLGVTSQINFQRGMRQFGVYGGTQHINSGIGRSLRYDHNKVNRFLYPNRVFDKELEIEIEGIHLHLFHAPGETNDQIVVWLPKKEVLLAADNFYRSFPNLYAIRGTPSRDAIGWATSLDLMRNLRPSFLVPSHTRPLYGKDQIYQILTDYRDAIQYVHDQTIRYTNKGYLPSEIIQLVRLPPHLDTSPFLQQFYGTVPWGVKGIFTSYLGWFSGDPVELNPLPPFEEAKRMVEMAGGVDLFFNQIRKFQERNDHQWTLKLSNWLMILGRKRKFQLNSPEEEEREREGDLVQKSAAYLKELVEIRSWALKGMASKQISANGRNYYITSMLENEGFEIKPSPTQKTRSILTSPLPNLFRLLSLNLRSENCLEVDLIATFHFPDLEKKSPKKEISDQDQLPKKEKISTRGGEGMPPTTPTHATIYLRRGVAEIQMRSTLPHEREADLLVSLSSRTWRGMLAKQVNPAVAYISGEIKIEKGNVAALASFLSYFQDE